MACFSKNKYNLSLFLILTLFSFQGMSRRIHKAPLSEIHEQWMVEHGKSYEDVAEKEKRFQIFKENVEFIESFNAAGNKSFKLSINQFADQTSDEFKASLNGQVMSLEEGIESETTLFRYDNVTEVPATMDWRERGAVTPIKNQHRCGSCWAFATVAAVEGIHQIATGSIMSLSEQELVDCVRGKTKGCEGGYVEDAYKFILKKRGIASEEEYPYKGVDGTCHVKKGTYSAATIQGYEKVPANNEKALLKAVANQPVSVYIESRKRAFQFYSSGVFTGKCGTSIDHVVTIVGYGTTNDGIEYWLVKNSWGTKWGEEGYIKMKRNTHTKKGLCGLAIRPIYPIA